MDHGRSIGLIHFQAVSRLASAKAGEAAPTNTLITSALSLTHRPIETSSRNVPYPAVDGKGERAKAARKGLATYCLGVGGFASGADAGATGSGLGVVPRSSEAAAQSPAQSLVPLTVPTSLQPSGANGFACFSGLPPALGAAV
jgi:hypothetical protein